MICIFQVIGKKDVGKTLLIERLTSKLVNLGYRIGVIKSTHHQIDLEGKDSYRFKQAGAKIVILSSSMETVIFLKNINVENLINLLPVDILFIEGFSQKKLGKRFEVTGINEVDKLESEILKEVELCKIYKPKIVINGEIIEAKEDLYLYLYKLLKNNNIKEVKILD